MISAADDSGMISGDGGSGDGGGVGSEVAVIPGGGGGGEGELLMQVVGQVMTRDESTGGWLPLGGGGMSYVSLRSLGGGAESVSSSPAEYAILGQRITDQTVILNCRLKKDVVYTRANPSFHHWRTEGKRFGLTFQSSVEAGQFEMKVKSAMASILGGPADVFCHDLSTETLSVSRDSSTLSLLPGETSIPATSSLLPSFADKSRQDNSNGETLRRPPLISHSSQPVRSISSVQLMRTHSASVVQTKPVVRQDVSNEGSGGLSAVLSNKISTEQEVQATGEITEVVVECQKSEVPGVDYTYVHFSMSPTPPPGHEYIDPTVVYTQPGSTVCATPSLEPIAITSVHDSPCSLQTHVIVDVPTTHSASPLSLPASSKSKNTKQRRSRLKQEAAVTSMTESTSTSSHAAQQRLLTSATARCVYCRATYDVDNNQPGSCLDAPDKLTRFIDCLSCSCCSRAVLYHCLSNDDVGGADHPHPCACETAQSIDENDDEREGAAGRARRRTRSKRCKKWLALAVLSAFVPCLWCYWPLTGCHWCGVRCGCCGGTHSDVQVPVRRERAGTECEGTT